MMCTSAEVCELSALVFPESPEVWEERGWVTMEGPRGYTLQRLDENGNFIESGRPERWAGSLAQMGYFHGYTINANRDAQKMMLEVYEDFWNRYVLTETPPEITDYDDVGRLFPSPKGTLVVSDAWVSKFNEYASINKEIGKSGHLSKRKEQLKVEILKFAKDETTVADDESIEKIVFMDESGNKCGQFDGKTFRA
jgi:hypothetical protein